MLRERMALNPYVQPTVEAYTKRMKQHQALDIDLKSSDVHELEQLRKTKRTLLFELVWDLMEYMLIGVCAGAVAGT